MRKSLFQVLFKRNERSDDSYIGLADFVLFFISIEKF